MRNPQSIAPSLVKRLASLELNALLFAGILPIDPFQGARLGGSGTPIYDMNGQRLFHRVPITKGQVRIAHSDIAAYQGLGLPLLAVGRGLDWSEKHLSDQAKAFARKRHRGIKFDRIRFVAYSYPKIAAQFLKDGEETLMLELYTWNPVPPKRKREPREPPSNFERWSLIDELPDERKRKNVVSFKKRLSRWNSVARRSKREFSGLLNTSVISKMFRIPPIVTSDTEELHFSPDPATHHPCYELRGQQTSVWCVAASVEMLLDFYRYNYQQTRIAQELGLGTLNNPNGLPYARDGDVVTALDHLTSNALTANMNQAPNWNQFVSEIQANRPLISFIPGHSRTVAGFTDTTFLGWFIFRGLLVYDPWPPNMGVITRWENFATQTYRVTYAAQLTLIP